MHAHGTQLDRVRRSRLRPYLDALDEAAGAQFEAEILEAAKRAYPVMQNGEIDFRFRRFFFIAVK